MAEAPDTFSVKLKTSFPVGFDVGWDVTQPPPFMGYPVTNNRVTEEDDNRITEEADNLVTQ